MTKKDKAFGALFGLAIGDGFGYPNEFLSFENQQKKWGEKGLQEPLPGVIKGTDDTQMTIAVLNAVQKSFINNKIEKKSFEIKLQHELANWYADERMIEILGKRV